MLACQVKAERVRVGIRGLGTSHPILGAVTLRTGLSAEVVGAETVLTCWHSHRKRERQRERDRDERDREREREGERDRETERDREREKERERRTLIQVFTCLLTLCAHNHS